MLCLAFLFLPFGLIYNDKLIIFTPLFGITGAIFLIILGGLSSKWKQSADEYKGKNWIFIPLLIIFDVILLTNILLFMDMLNFILVLSGSIISIILYSIYSHRKSKKQKTK